MQVIRRRRPAGRAVVEHKIVLVPGGEVEHVRHVVPYLLRHVGIARDDEVSGKDRIGIDLDVIFPALTALELQVTLLRRTVLLAQEALSRGNRLRRGVGCRRDSPLRVELQGAPEAAHGQLAPPCLLERPEVGRCELPHRELVLYEFPQFFHGSGVFTEEPGARRRCACTPTRNLE